MSFEQPHLALAASLAFEALSVTLATILLPGDYVLQSRWRQSHCCTRQHHDVGGDAHAEKGSNNSNVTDRIPKVRVRMLPSASGTEQGSIVKIESTLTSSRHSRPCHPGSIWGCRSRAPPGDRSRRDTCSRCSFYLPRVSQEWDLFLKNYRTWSPTRPVL